MLAAAHPSRGAGSARDSGLVQALEHHRAGRLDDAARLYQQLHAANRRDTEVLFLMGVLCCDLGLFESACRFLGDALAIAPVFPEARAQLSVALNGLSILLAEAGRVADAQGLLERALALTPHDAPTLQGLGRVALMRGEAAVAEQRLAASLAQRACHSETLNWLGLAQLQLGKHAAAESSLRQTLLLQPDLTQAHNNLGLALHRQGRFAEAEACFETALRRDPEYHNARINLANTLRIVGRPEQARLELERVVAARPTGEALNNLGAVLQDLGYDELALGTLERAAALSPASEQVCWNLALTQLALGDFTNGWKNFEARWEGCDHLRGAYVMPPDRAWRGQPLENARLLLWAEQGFGDALQFVRFARELAAAGAHVAVYAQPELAALLASAPGVSAVVPWGRPLPPYDFHCPLMSLPCRLGLTDAAQLRRTEPYLAPEQPRVVHWRERLSGHTGLKVGLAWAGSARLQSPELAAIDARRSIALPRLAPLLAVRQCSFYSLQKGAASLGCESAAAAAAVHDFSHEWNDFSATAAFVANLDLVISVDTAVAHLAGALGKPVWLLNRHDACWRWLRMRSDSPWYEGLRQFRQSTSGDWEAVIVAAAAGLAGLATA